MEQTIAILNDANFAHTIFEHLDVSDSTRKDYISRINLFLGFIKQRDFHLNSFLEYKHYLKEKTNLTTATKNKYLAVSKVFLKEMNRQLLIPTDITQNVKSFKQSKKHKRDGLNEEEINLLVEKLNNTKSTPRSIRLKAILGLLILQGLRECEITRLNVNDIDLVNSTAFICGKGRDDKELIYLHPEATKALRKYLKVNKIADGALFVSISNSSRDHRLTTRGLRKIVKEFLDILKIDKNVHGFRHYFVTALIKSYKGDLLEVARYTRHKSLEMLQVYDDSIKLKADLPRFYSTFSQIHLGKD